MLPTLVTVTLAIATLANPLPPSPATLSHLDAVPVTTDPDHGIDAGLATPQLRLCSSANCATGCTVITMSSSLNGCYWAGDFVSVELIDPSNQDPPNYIHVAPDNCTDWLAIPSKASATT